MITDKQLAVAIPTAFPELFPDAMKHDWEDIRPYNNGGIRRGRRLRCRRCFTHLKHQDCTIIDDSMICEKAPTPIVLDWNTAHKVVQECEQDVIREALYNIWYDWQAKDKTKDVSFDNWLLIYATPADYLRAALEAVKGVE